MSDLTFRTKSEPRAEQAKQTEAKDVHVSGNEVEIEGPYTDYEMQHSIPYVVEHFDLGKFWNTDEVYTKEVGVVESFLLSKIKSKTISNSLDAVKDYMKEIEGLCGVKTYTPKTERLAKILQYIKTMKD